MVYHYTTSMSTMYLDIILEKFLESVKTRTLEKEECKKQRAECVIKMQTAKDH